MADKTNKLTYVVEINDKGKVKIEGLTKSFVKADAAVNKLTADLKAQQAAMGGVTKDGLNPMIDKTGLAGATLVELGRTISDSNYGIRGMANNLSQLSTLMITLITTTGGVVNGFRALLGALMGPLGLILIFQTVITLIERQDMEAQKLKKSTKSLGDFVSKTAGDFEVYIRKLQDANTSQEQQELAIKRLKKEFPDFIKQLNDSSVSFEDIKNKTNAASAAINKYRQEIVKLAFAKAAQAKIEKLAGEAIDKELEAIDKLKEGGKTLDQARELWAKREEIRQNEALTEAEKQVAINKLFRDSIVEGKEEFNKFNLDAVADIVDGLDTENIKIQEQINLLVKRINLEDYAEKKGKKDRKEKSDYDALEIGNFDKKIRGLVEMGQIREYFFNRDLEIDAMSNENTIQAIELEQQQNLNRLNALKELGLLETELAVAKYEVNLFYSKLLAQEQERLDRQGYAMRMEMFGHYADSLGSISGLMKENSKASKTFALLEIAANTAIGFSQGLTLAQQQAKEAAPVSALAFPLFYASQIAAVLAAANRAKSILSGGSIGGSVGGGPGASVEAPDFNVVGASPESQLAQSITGQQEKPLRAFVVNKDIKDAEELDRTIDFNRSLG
jgi:hypothetical protein